MKFANATKLDRKSGFAQWRDLRFHLPGVVKAGGQLHRKPHADKWTQQTALKGGAGTKNLRSKSLFGRNKGLLGGNLLGRAAGKARSNPTRA
jgi:hypothetical protein